METNKLKWSNLQQGLCPKCDMLFNYEEIREGAMIRCPSNFCTYQISYGKFIDLQKGNKSSVYKSMTKYYKSVDKYKEKVKSGYKKGIDAQNKEREANIKRMKARGLLTE